MSVCEAVCSKLYDTVRVRCNFNFPVTVISWHAHAHNSACLMDAGKTLCDPFGQQRFVIPHLFSFVGDEPELKDVFCIKGAGSKHPCELCMVDSASLNDVAFPPRMQRDQVRIHDAALPVRGSCSLTRPAICTSESVYQLGN